jgi:hypothetical protein
MTTQTKTLTTAGKLFVQIGNRRFEVGSLQEASEKFCHARDQYGEGASKTPRAIIVDGAGKQIGHIAYNGRIFPGRSRDWKPDTKPLLDNRAA